MWEEYGGAPEDAPKTEEEIRNWLYNGMPNGRRRYYESDIIVEKNNTN